MRLTAFASRNTKEILRDPLTFFFGLGFPVVLLLLLSAINSAIPEQAQMTMFNIDKLTPGITVFGMSFILAVLVNAHCKGQNHKLYDEIVHISAQSTRVYYRLHTSAFANGNFAECRMRCCCVLPRT